MPLYNPYEGVDWETVEHYQSVTHAHPRTGANLESAAAQGVRHLATTEYDYWSYPFTEFYDPVPPGLIQMPNTERGGFFGVPTSWIHISTPGSLLRPDQTGAVMTGHNVPWIHDPAGDGHWKSLTDAAVAAPWHENYVMLQINHPMRRTAPDVADPVAMARWMNEFYDYAPEHNKLLEIYNDSTNNPSRTGAWAVEMWQESIKTGRRIFAVMSPDHTIRAGAFRGRNYVLLPGQSSPTDFAEAYFKGQFYCALEDTSLKFKSIIASGGEVSVEAEGSSVIRFITDDGLLLDTTSAIASVQVPEGAVFIRIEIESSDNVAFSQPIFYRDLGGVDHSYGRRKAHLLLHQDCL